MYDTKQIFDTSYSKCALDALTRWGWVTHLCVRKLSLVQIMACRLIGAKTLSNPMPEYCWLHLWEQTSWNLIRNLYISIQENAYENIWKLRPFGLGFDGLRLKACVRDIGKFGIEEAIRYGSGKAVTVVHDFTHYFVCKLFNFIINYSTYVYQINHVLKVCTFIFCTFLQSFFLVDIFHRYAKHRCADRMASSI